MKTTIKIVAIVLFLSACQEKPKPSHDITEDVKKIGKSWRSIKDAFKEGYNDTTKIKQNYNEKDTTHK